MKKAATWLLIIYIFGLNLLMFLAQVRNHAAKAER